MLCVFAECLWSVMLCWNEVSTWQLLSRELTFHISKSSRAAATNEMARAWLGLDLWKVKQSFCWEDTACFAHHTFLLWLRRLICMGLLWSLAVTLSECPPPPPTHLFILMALYLPSLSLHLPFRLFPFSHSFSVTVVICSSSRWRGLAALMANQIS